MQTSLPAACEQSSFASHSPLFTLKTSRTIEKHLYTSRMTLFVSTESITFADGRSSSGSIYETSFAFTSADTTSCRMRALGIYVTSTIVYTAYIWKRMKRNQFSELSRTISFYSESVTSAHNRSISGNIYESRSAFANAYITTRSM